MLWDPLTRVIKFGGREAGSGDKLADWFMVSAMSTGSEDSENDVQYLRPEANGW